MKPEELIGKRFGRLTVVCLSHKDKWSKNYYDCVCDCGGKTKVLERNLITGNTSSCGCLRRETVKAGTNTKNGKTHTRLYGIWFGIKKRTTDKKSKSYKNYGGRGISVCDEWKKDFMSFYNWAMEHGYKDNLTLDRIDNNGNYCPENCRWATSQEQSRNTRKNNLITYNGQTHCATEWEDILGFKRGILYARQKLGWSVERMMTQKSRQDHSDKRNLSASMKNRAY